MFMEKYSSSYGGTKESFVILNNTSKDKRELTNVEYGLFCVIQNIIQRGTPTEPSIFLKEKLGIIPEELNPLYLIDDTVTKWKKLIKGDDEHVDYPAIEFFEKLLPQYLGEYSFVKNLIIPEADFADILLNDTVLCGQQVDFYLPQTKTVFEIDGNSHESSSQTLKDTMRDTALTRNKIQVIRIKTENIKKNTTKLANELEEFKKKIKDNPVIDQYKSDLMVSRDDIRIKYDAVIRLQILLLSCLKNGKLHLGDKKWNFHIQNSDIPQLEYLLSLAYEDLKCWANTIAKLLKISLKFPEFSIVNEASKDTFILDFGMFKRYTDEIEENRNCTYIRTDYFMESNYYEVAFADSLQYQLRIGGEESDLPNLQYLLKNFFGFDEFRDGQLQIIMNVLERNDTIGILPTGTGKSLCYQYASLLQPGVSIVVVPIISLMIDQKRSMDQKHMTRTNLISSQLRGEEKSKILAEFQQGQYQLLWMAPERFQNEDFRKSLSGINRTMNFSLAVIDEVHCLSEWGHDFRVSYLTLIRTLRAHCPEACLLGLTATASQAVLEDLKAEFENDGSGIKALTSMNRNELMFKRIKVESRENKFERIKQVIKEVENIYQTDLSKQDGKDSRCGLVFCPTVAGRNDGCQTICEQLSSIDKFKNRVGTYHGKLENGLREKVQKDFMDDQYSILVCTKAFGMGIDKSNIKYTIHTCLPQSIESFYQEAGRAGRDADKTEKSYCYILYSPENEGKGSDIRKIFKADIGIEERKLISEGLSQDLATIMFLWNLNKKTVSEEYKSISDVLGRLYKGETQILFHDSSKKGQSLEEIQNALYKLSLLGIVDSWTVNYHSLLQGDVNVIYNGCNEKDIEEHLLTYIRKYDLEFNLDGKVKRYENYYKMLLTEEKFITKLIKVLLAWGNENILYQRLQSTYNMMELCDPKVTDEEFRRRIDYYFRYSETSIIFEGILYHPKDYDNWFDLLFIRDDETMNRSVHITKEKAENILASLQRYLESYRNNTGLNFLSGILRIYCGTYHKSEGVERLHDSLQSIKEMTLVEQEEVIVETLKFAKIFSLEQKEQLSEAILKEFPQRGKQIFNALQDRYSLSIELEKSVYRLKKIIEEKIEWTT